MKKLFIIFSLFISQFAMAAGDPEAIKGIWSLVQDGTLISIEFRDGSAEGFISKRPDNRQNEVDQLNPNPALRNRPILGLQVLKDLTFASPGHWRGGLIYDPDSGETYNAQAKLEDNETLMMRGYVGIPLLGRSTVLKRVH